MAPSTTTDTLTPDSTMRDVLLAFPGAQRALFARYHIGGCQSCGFQPSETIAQICERNDNLPVEEVIAHIVESHEGDQRILIAPVELKDLLAGPNPPRLVDIRTREEYDAVHLENAHIFSQDLLNQIFAEWPKESPIVIYDHSGSRTLDAATYLIGHGFSNVKCLEGGIDQYAAKIDPSLTRYKIEFED